MGNRKKPLIVLVLLIFFLSFESFVSIEMNTINPGHSLSGNQTITSKNGRFELGFFKPDNSTDNYYLGIWYKKLPVQTVVWVANRDKPFLDPFNSKLQLSERGNLVLCSQSEILLWSTDSLSNSMNSTVAVLENSGNFVLINSSNPSDILWQSFDHPTDTWLSGAKLGIDKKTKRRQIYIAWRNSTDPAPGPFSLVLDPNGTSTYHILQNGNTYWTCGIWLERVSSFSTDTVDDKYTTVNYVSNEKENFYVYAVSNSSILVRFVIDVSGQLQQLIWQDDSQKWKTIWAKPKDQCEIFGFCGYYGACNQFSTTTCRCLPGFEPKIPGEWSTGNHTHGCRRRTPLRCNNGVKDGFTVIPNIRLPGNDAFLTNNKSFEECESSCLRDCSCTAYSYDGNCSLWREDLLNIQYLSYGDNLGRDLHLRLTMTERAALRRNKNGTIEWFIICAVAAILILFAILGLIVSTCRRTNFSKPAADVLVLFQFSDIKRATKNFSEKLGEGGFGSVFKGTLPNSAAIAVKSLKCQVQEDKQFRAEVSTIGTIHHVNLIRLLGFCVKGMKRFLVYDYMPNGSLDSHLFYKDSKILDWKTRHRIAVGVARGLAYLHEECRECIIHCDIKPENILLDADYNPLISDFGLAKLLGRDFSRVLTTMKGTRGYLAPEMISGEPITPKSDVFSYGMLLLEIISGRRNWEIRDDGTENYFPALAAICISNGGDVLSLLDSKLPGNANVNEVIRACRVACWCIQDEEQNRPSMGQVVQILEGVQEINMPPIPRFIQTITSYDLLNNLTYENSCSSSLMCNVFSNQIPSE